MFTSAVVNEIRRYRRLRFARDVNRLSFFAEIGQHLDELLQEEITGGKQEIEKNQYFEYARNRALCRAERPDGETWRSYHDLGWSPRAVARSGGRSCGIRYLLGGSRRTLQWSYQLADSCLRCRQSLRSPGRPIAD